ncbi:MAG TPA: o-succinylbenzoate synthase [Chryseolinea sp.]|nr:o-succinylbenzoate synthase [Chryseolinea sp.]
MGLKITYTKHTFQFAFDARTSRGLMTDKTSWMLNVWDEQYPDERGIGECGPLPGLSVDAAPDFETRLDAIVNDIMLSGFSAIDVEEQLPCFVPASFPSIRFGLETALLDLSNGGTRVIYSNDFIAGKPIPINGLIWMGNAGSMLDQVKQKLDQGFHCLKLKVGGLDFETECEVIAAVRRYAGNEITIRLDANGSFPEGAALVRLEKLARHNIHSIEQPLMKGSELTATLCEVSPIPIALDEELIGVYELAAKENLLKAIKPQYIILKPTLHGGLHGCMEWIRLAERLEVGWWITSALESNIGLNAICQFTANFNVAIPQGLGTGGIYVNNIQSPLAVSMGNVFHDQTRTWGN